jgi:hypothetical protein
MTKRAKERAERLLPAGVPRWIRVYDNDGETADRYTVVFTGRYKCCDRHCGMAQILSMSASPFHPQGVGMHAEAPKGFDCNRSGFAPAIGRRNHLGKRITFAELPEDCRTIVMRDYRELWSLDGVAA